MSKYLSGVLSRYRSLQKEFNLEMPCIINGILVGYRLMNERCDRRFLCGVETAADKNNIPLPYDILTTCRERGLILIAAVGDQLFRIDCKQIHWGNPYHLKGIAFAYINLIEVGAIEIFCKAGAPIDSTHDDISMTYGENNVPQTQ